MKKALEYLKDRYLEEQARFDHFENKCSRFLTFVTIIIAGITALAGMKDGTIFHPGSAVEWIAFTLFIIGSFTIACSWGHALLALRIGDCSVMPRSRETANYLLAVDDNISSEHIFNSYIDTLEKLSEEIDSKARNLELAYEELTISAWCLGLAAPLVIYMELAK